MPTLPERIAQSALQQFDKLPSKCKPRTHPDGRREWTPLSAVVAVRGNLVQCLALGTGTKCLPASALPKCRGTILHDNHAEVLALRGFNRWALTEMKSLLSNTDFESLYIEQSFDVSQQDARIINDQHYLFRFKDDVSFHLFTTEAPCGDASMELLIQSKDPEDAVPWLASSTNTEASGVPSLLGRGHFTHVGLVRRKPARNDAEATLSKSCTDKLAVKQFTGILSFPADIFIEPSHACYLQSIVVYRDQCDPVAYERAFGSGGRLASCAKDGRFFEFKPLPDSFPRFDFEKTRKVASIKASNISTVWITGSDKFSQEVVQVLLNGVKQGYKQFEDRVGKESVLCRKSFWKLGDTVAMLSDQALTSTQLMDDLNLRSALRAIQNCLNARTYNNAKGRSIRAVRRVMKSVVVEKLGGWIPNLGDADWSLKNG